MLVRTLSTAICASDVHSMDRPEVVANDGRFVYDPHRDLVLGHEFVGEVVAHGPGGAGTHPIGTRVTAMPVLLVDGGLAGTKVIGQHPEAPGSFGELLVVSEAMARAVPDGVPSDAVALVDAFAVGEFYVRSSRIEPGEVPIVVGGVRTPPRAIPRSSRATVSPATSSRGASGGGSPSTIQARSAATAARRT